MTAAAATTSGFHPNVGFILGGAAVGAGIGAIVGSSENNNDSPGG
jgi:hypothetical protein